ncbi:MAG: hypothetical protein Q7S27_03175 [Nanoarchaeota archaeon]|nr:hypothetical protein [Nanoarchaeota archaeon]
MLSWWLISILVVVLFVTVFKSQDLVNVFVVIKKNLFLIFTVSLVLFVGYSVYHITSTYDVDFTSYDGIVRGGKLYFLWFKSLFSNVGRISGYAVQQDWILNNTNVTGK